MKSRRVTTNFYAEDLCHFLGLNPFVKYTSYFIFKRFQRGCLWRNDNCLLSEENNYFLNLCSQWIHKSQLKSILRCYIVYHDINLFPTYGSPSFQYAHAMGYQQPVHGYESNMMHTGYTNYDSPIIYVPGLEESKWYNQTVPHVKSPGIPPELALVPESTKLVEIPSDVNPPDISREFVPVPGSTKLVEVVVHSSAVYGVDYMSKEYIRCRFKESYANDSYLEKHRNTGHTPGCMCSDCCICPNAPNPEVCTCEECKYRIQERPDYDIPSYRLMSDDNIFFKLQHPELYGPKSDLTGHDPRCLCKDCSLCPNLSLGYPYTSHCNCSECTYKDRIVEFPGTNPEDLIFQDNLIFKQQEASGYYIKNAERNNHPAHCLCSDCSMCPKAKFGCPYGFNCACPECGYKDRKSFIKGINPETLLQECKLHSLIPEENFENLNTRTTTTASKVSSCQTDDKLLLSERSPTSDLTSKNNANTNATSVCCTSTTTSSTTTASKLSSSLSGDKFFTSENPPTSDLISENKENSCHNTCSSEEKSECIRKTEGDKSHVSLITPNFIEEVASSNCIEKMADVIVEGPKRKKKKRKKRKSSSTKQGDFQSTQKV